MSRTHPEEAARLMELFQIDSLEPVLERQTFIVPVNITYYPLRARENILSSLAVHLSDRIPERAVEEMITEGSMLLSGVDMDIRFGAPIEIKKFMKRPAIKRDISSKQSIRFDDPIPSKGAMRKVALKIMQRYMSAIYSMTTVNHDHVFASLLKLIPFKKISTFDLRQRAFLTVEDHLEGTGVHLHKELRLDQIHLLVDDRLDKFNNFIEVAEEKGVVVKTGDGMVKDRSKFISAFDFHRIRIDNPVAVVANEVEPLKALQRRVRRLAWMPGFWLRRRIARYLIKKATEEFHRDYEKFYTENESKKKDVGQPFLVKGRSHNTGVVLIHGYMAAPLEVRELADYLGRKGLWVYVPRLKGHGTSPEDLAVRSYGDWLASVETGYAIIRSLCKEVVVGGFSAGAGMALDLAARVKDIKGVFAVCPPMRLKDFSSKFVPAVDVWNRLMDRVRLDGAKKEFVENFPENPHINYFRNPVSGVLELERLMESLEEKLPAIEMPALVIQSLGDPVVKPSGSRRAFDLMGSEDKTYILYNFDRHGILLGKGADRVHRAIGDFIENVN
jgi:esterase/lipase